MYSKDTLTKLLSEVLVLFLITLISLHGITISCHFEIRIISSQDQVDVPQFEELLLETSLIIARYKISVNPVCLCDYFAQIQVYSLEKDVLSDNGFIYLLIYAIKF